MKNLLVFSLIALSLGAFHTGLGTSMHPSSKGFWFANDHDGCNVEPPSGVVVVVRGSACNNIEKLVEKLSKFDIKALVVVTNKRFPRLRTTSLPVVFSPTLPTILSEEEMMLASERTQFEIISKTMCNEEEFYQQQKEQQRSSRGLLSLALASDLKTMYSPSKLHSEETANNIANVVASSSSSLPSATSVSSPSLPSISTSENPVGTSSSTLTSAQASSFQTFTTPISGGGGGGGGGSATSSPTAAIVVSSTAAAAAASSSFPPQKETTTTTAEHVIAASTDPPAITAASASSSTTTSATGKTNDDSVIEDDDSDGFSLPSRNKLIGGAVGALLGAIVLSLGVFWSKRMWRRYRESKHFTRIVENRLGMV